MKNKLLSPTKMMAGITILAGILGTTKESLAQNLASNQKNKAQTENTNGVASNINIHNTNDPIGYAFDNIDKYYPIKNNTKVNEHMTKLRQHRNTTRGKIKGEEVNKILNSIQRPNNRTEKDIITFIVGITELEVVRSGTDFADNFREEDQIPEETKYYDLFKKTYTDRFNAYEKQFNANLAQLQQRIRELEQSIQNREQSIQNREQSIQNREQSIQNRIKNINEALSVFTPEEVAQNQFLYNNIKTIKENFEKDGRKGSPHTEKLFSVIK